MVSVQRVNCITERSFESGASVALNRPLQASLYELEAPPFGLRFQLRPNRSGFDPTRRPDRSLKALRTPSFLLPMHRSAREKGLSAVILLQGQCVDNLLCGLGDHI